MLTYEIKIETLIKCKHQNIDILATKRKIIEKLNNLNLRKTKYESMDAYKSSIISIITIY